MRSKYREPLSSPSLTQILRQPWTVFGIPREKWAALHPATRKQLISQAHSMLRRRPLIKAWEERNEELVSVVDRLSLNQKASDALWRTTRKLGYGENVEDLRLKPNLRLAAGELFARRLSRRLDGRGVRQRLREQGFRKVEIDAVMKAVNARR